MTENVAHRQELWLLILDDTAVGRYVDFTVGESIECIQRLVAAHTGSKMHQYLHMGSGIILHLASLNFALFHSFQYAIYQCGGSFSERNLLDNQCLIVQLFYLGTHLEYATALTVIIFTHIYTAARREVGIEVELLTVQISNGSITYLTEVMRKYLGRQSHGNSFCTLCQQQRKLDRQRDRLLVTTIVRELPVCGLGIKYCIHSKLTKPCLYISGSSSTVARKDVTPVTLAVNEQILLSQLHQGIADGGITMRMELHGMSHDVRHLIVAPVVHALHGVKDTALHRFETILQMRYGTLQNYIGCIIQKPVLIHAAQMMYGGSIKPVYGFIIGVGILPYLLFIAVLLIVV